MSVPKPRKILHFTGCLNRGGIETWLLQMVQNLDRTRYEVHIAVDSDEEFDYSAEFRAAQCRIIPCFFPSKRFSYIPRILDMYRRYGPYDIVHSHVDNRSGLNCLLAKMAGVPVRIIHNHPSILTAKSPRQRRHQSVAFASARLGATHLLGCSQTSLEVYLQASRLKPQRSAVLYNAVDLEKYSQPSDKLALRRRLNLPENIPVVSYVARFSPHKNHRQLFRVADRMNSPRKRIQFVLAGSYGPSMQEIRDLAAERSDTTLFLGLEDVSQLLLASDAFLFPSLHEGFGIVAIEAAAAGLPIVATKLDAIKEACPPAHHSLMFDADNDDQAIASLERALNDNELREQLSKSATQWAAKFSIGASLDSLLAFYEDALAQQTAEPSRNVARVGSV